MASSPRSFAAYRGGVRDLLGSAGRYNDLLLETGAVPLTVLSKAVDGWIASGGRMEL